MTREEREEAVASLPDKRWERLMRTFQESRDGQIRRDELQIPEVVAIHQCHYDELLGKILELAERDLRKR